MNELKALVIFFVVFLSGCSLHQPIEPSPPAPVPGSFAQPGSRARDLWNFGRGWEKFNDPCLNKLIEEALQKSPDIKEAFARVEQAEAVFQKEQASRFPFLNGGYSWSRQSQPGFFGKDTGNSYRLSLAAGFEVDLWQKLKKNAEAQRLEADASKEDLFTLYLTISSQVADFYYLVAEAREQIELTDRTISSLEESLERVESRYRAGLVPAVDVYQARQNLAQAKARRPIYVVQEESALHALSVLLGHYPEENSWCEDAVTSLPPVPSMFPSGLPSEVLAKRPDVRSALLRLKANDARVAAAVADRFPSLDLLAGYGRSSTAFSAGSIVGDFWSLGFEAALPLLDGGKRRAEIRRRKAVVKEFMARYHKAVLRSFQEVEDALSKNVADEDRIKSLEADVEASYHSLRLARKRYFYGLTDYLPVLTAETLYLNSQSALISARRELISDRITLFRSLGGDWMEALYKSQLHGEKDGS